MRRVPILSMLALAAVTMGLLASGVAAADNYFMGRSVYGYAGYSPGGSLYINALPSDAEVRLDGVPIGQANDLQASLVETHAGVHTLTFQAPGYEPASVLVPVVRDWTTRVRLTLIPSR